MRLSRNFILKALSFFLCILFLGANSSSAIEQSAPDISGASDAYTQLYKWFNQHYENNVYPAEYGGEFLDGNMLCLYIVGLNEFYIEKYTEICGHEWVTFLDADYSLNYLNTLYDLASEYAKFYNISGFCVDRTTNRFRIDIAPEWESEELRQAHAADWPADSLRYRAYTSSETLSALQKLLQNEAITFGEADYVNYELTPAFKTSTNASNPNSRAHYSKTQINGGTLATVSGIRYFDSGQDNNLPFTLGIGGTFETSTGTVDAILTAGHCIQFLKWSSTANRVNVNGSPIVVDNDNSPSSGFIRWQYADDQAGDYAILLVDEENYETTSNLYKSGTSTVTANSANFSGMPPINYPITRYGISTGFKSMTIQDLNYTIVTYYTGDNATLLNPSYDLDEDGTFCITGMVRASGSLSNVSAGGDSGGPVYCTVGSDTEVLGVISGHATNENAPSTAYLFYTPLSLVDGFTPKLS